MDGPLFPEVLAPGAGSDHVAGREGWNASGQVNFHRVIIAMVERLPVQIVSRLLERRVQSLRFSGKALYRE
jgi:hypothetical protein